MHKNQTFIPKINVSLTFLTSSSALFLGGLIYILFRPQPAGFFNWIKALVFDGQFQQLRNFQFLKQTNLPNRFVYSFPNFLWAFAYSLLIVQLWWNSTSALKYLWLTSIPLFILIYELLQVNQILSDIFCFKDIIAGLIGIVTGALLGLNFTLPNTSKRIET